MQQADWSRHKRVARQAAKAAAVPSQQGAQARSADKACRCSKRTTNISNLASRRALLVAGIAGVLSPWQLQLLLLQLEKPEYSAANHSKCHWKKSSATS